MFCNKCGAEIDINDKFCNSCGEKIENKDIGSIIFKREKQYYGCIVPIKVFMDGNLVATLNSNTEVTVNTTIGKHKIMFDLWSGNGAEEDLTRLRNLAMVIKDTALCGLGQTSPNPVLSTMDNFYDEYLAHVREHRCPSHQCRELTQYFINPV